MLKQVETQKVLTKFADKVTRQAKANLKNQSTSGKLEKSIDYDLEVFKNSFSLAFEMEEYGQYQDQGVNGLLKKHGSPFSYRDKWPPLKAFDKWIVNKGLTPRNAKGQFMSRQSLKFLIARKIFFYGIKPTKFFSKAFDQEFKKLPTQVIEAYGLDTEKFLKSTLTNKK